MHIQSINQAVVFAGSRFRVYVPYTGNLTLKKQTTINQAFQDYCETKNLDGDHDTPRWKTSDVKIKRTGETNESYSENGAGGNNRCFVCCAFKMPAPKKRSN